MKKSLLLFLLAFVLSAFSAGADIVIDGKAYRADTLVYRQVGPGMINVIVRLPDFPLNVYVVTVDLNNPNNRVETTYGRGIVGKTELLADAVKRHRTPTKRPIAACNANFWIVTGSGYPFNAYAMGSPNGGVVCNDTTIVNDNNTSDMWSGGPTETGVAAITSDKTLVMGRVRWDGIITSSKLPQWLIYHNINRRAVTGEICLWGPAYTRTRKFEDDWVSFDTRGDNASDNYYLMFAEGEDWCTNKPMTFVVANIVPGMDKQTLGDYDACLTVTGDANKAAMAVHAVGDTIQLSSYWTNLDADAATVITDVENLVTGNATIMHNGELTYRNYGDGYNSIDYSRTCYGTSADGKHLYLLVIDKSVSPLYGKSIGCTTGHACQILQQMCPDVNDMVNMDAGGSAEMLVRGEIINRTMEGTPRGVATGWMVEAIGEEDNELASIAFEKHRVDIPSYATMTPRILGYNKIGELIDEDVKGFTLSCDEAIGTADGDVFVAGSEDATGLLTATLGEMTATMPVHVLATEPGLVLKPIVIDKREYPVEVSAQVLDNTYFFDPATLHWTVEDPEVASVTNGVLSGKANGETQLSCMVGTFNDTTQVQVQLAPSAYLYEGWNDWTLRGVGAKNMVLDEETGDITYTYVTNRSPSLSLAKDLTFYGLPDTIGMVFNSSLPIDYVQIDTRNRFKTKTNYIKYFPEDGSEVFEPGKDYRIVLDLASLGGSDYVGTYPVSIKLIKFSINKDAEAGEQTLSIKSLYCHYPLTGLERLPGDVNGDDEVNIADVNAIIDVILSGASVLPAADVNHDSEVNIADINAVIDIILTH